MQKRSLALNWWGDGKECLGIDNGRGLEMQKHVTQVGRHFTALPLI